MDSAKSVEQRKHVEYLKRKDDSLTTVPATTYSNRLTSIPK